MNRKINTNREVHVPRHILNILLTVAVVLVGAVGAQADDLTDRIQQRYDSLQSFRGFFLQKLTNASSREVQERLGNIAFARPRFIRWETTSPENELLIIGKDTVWEYFPDEETVYRYTVEQVLSSKTMIRFLSGEANLKDDFTVQDMGMDGEFRHLKLIPKEPEPNLVEGEVWVRPGQDIMERIKLVDFFGNVNELELTGLELDVPVDEKEFTLVPPKGTEIIEGLKEE
ncbi:Outer-membrane lipoprotein carrier protein [anaerobic digester metagenome]